MMKSILKKNNKRSGFTILETIFAILVISVTIAGLFTMVRTILVGSLHTKDEVKAFYLAREAVEILRNKRDSNQLNKIINDPNTHWLKGIAEGAGDPCFFNSVCLVDSSSMSFSPCGSDWSSCQTTLKQSPSTFIHNYGAYPDTKFRRVIKLEYVNDKEVVVYVKVFWNRGIVTHQITVKTLLLNWI